MSLNWNECHLLKSIWRHKIISKRHLFFPHLLFSRLLASSTWCCGRGTSGSSSRRRASSLPSCGLRLPRRNHPPEMPTASRGLTNRTLTLAARVDTNPTTTSRDTTRWSEGLSWWRVQELKPQDLHWFYDWSDHFLLNQFIVCFLKKSLKKKLKNLIDNFQVVLIFFSFFSGGSAGSRLCPAGGPHLLFQSDVSQQETGGCAGIK